MIYRAFFLGGLLLMLIGQLLLAKGHDFVYSQQPIDFAHWAILLGAVCLIPQVVVAPPNVFSYVGIPLTLVGIACTIGMCVLDFIWWSFPTDEARAAFTAHLAQVPSIWQPFIAIGPSSKVFNLGLFILSLPYYPQTKDGVGTIMVATLLLWHAIPLSPRLPLGYLLTLIGYGIIFLRKQPATQSAGG